MIPKQSFYIMWDILERLYGIAKSYTARKDEGPQDRGRTFEKQYHAGKESFSRNSGRDYGTRADRESYGYDREDYTSADVEKDYPGGRSQLKEDLAVFGLKPPSSLKEIQHVRNRELKKYHADLHVGDEEKFAASNEIMQIFNAAYERLSKYYAR